MRAPRRGGRAQCLKFTKARGWPVAAAGADPTLREMWTEPSQQSDSL